MQRTFSNMGKKQKITMLHHEGGIAIRVLRPEDLGLSDCLKVAIKSRGRNPFGTRISLYNSLYSKDVCEQYRSVVQECPLF